MLISINSRTTGKFTREMINGRSHLVTSMMPIRGNIAMNGLFYPLDEVKKSFMQLNKLPAPNGHPKVNGVHISAFDPIAMNAHNVGAFTRNPVMKGKEVFTDVLIDETVANLSDDGREIIKRITEGGKIGVSTGLSINQVTDENGTDELGANYSRTGFGFNFDHVAILLNEKAAGEHAGTEMILNTDDADDPIFVVNMADDYEPVTNELSADDIHGELRDLVRTPGNDDVYTWVSEVFPESKSFIFSTEPNGGERQLFKQSYAIDSNDNISLLDDRVEVKRVTEFVQANNSEDQEMNKDLLVSLIIANALNAFTSKDKDRLTAMNESDLVDALCVDVDADKAREVLTANGFDFTAFDNFTANKDQFDAFQTAENDRLDKIREEITTNSDYTAELLADKSETELLVINKMITDGGHATRAPEGTAPVVNSGESVDPLQYKM